MSYDSPQEKKLLETTHSYFRKQRAVVSSAVYSPVMWLTKIALGSVGFGCTLLASSPPCCRSPLLVFNCRLAWWIGGLLWLLICAGLVVCCGLCFCSTDVASDMLSMTPWGFYCRTFAAALSFGLLLVFGRHFVGWSNWQRLSCPADLLLLGAADLDLLPLAFRFALWPAYF
ncbi:hypothetical protein U1Q18_019136 [Sarracenia purpurea var. burkii]